MARIYPGRGVKLYRKDINRGKCIISGGFTLIELMIVLAIIVVLAAFLFPVFNRSREAARRTTCISNLKQIGAAALMYAQSNDGHMPPYSNQYGATDPEDTPSPEPFFDAMSAYLAKDSEVWFCPSDSLKHKHTPNQRNDLEKWTGVPTCDHFYSSYIFIPNEVSDSGFAQRLTQLAEKLPADMVFAYDDDFSDAPGFEYDEKEKLWKLHFDSISSGLSGNHKDGANCLFYDGHVKYFPYGKTISTFN